MQAGSNSSNLTPSLGTSICPKKIKEKERKLLVEKEEKIKEKERKLLVEKEEAAQNRARGSPVTSRANVE